MQPIVPKQFLMERSSGPMYMTLMCIQYLLNYLYHYLFFNPKAKGITLV